jgi:hypothetical protein
MFNQIMVWLRRERNAYQVKKFDYETEVEKPVDYWMQQFDSYLQRIPLFGIDTPQGLQATLKLAATAIACAEHIAERVEYLPKPGVPSGTIEKW